MVTIRFSGIGTRAVFASIAALMTCSCSPDPRDLHIEQVAKSPDGSLTAAYLENTGGGAAVGTGFDVYVFDGAAPTAYSERVFSDECVTDVRISWQAPKMLRISFGARAGYKTVLPAGPWWALGRPSHGVTVRLEPHVSNNPYLC